MSILPDLTRQLLPATGPFLSKNTQIPVARWIHAIDRSAARPGGEIG